MYILIIFTICLAAGVNSQTGFKVSQPQTRTMNPDGSVIISCAHNVSASSLEDARLYRISPKNNTEKLLCRKGTTPSSDAFLQILNPNMCLFILLHIDAEAMEVQYQCELTIRKDHLDYTSRGSPTRLVPGNNVISTTPSTLLPSTPTSPGPLTNRRIVWIFYCVFALVFLYSCVITTLFFRKKKKRTEPDNLYVVMRTAPPVNNF